MKNIFAIYIALCSLPLLCTSCLSDDNDDTYVVDPYAALLSFSIGDFYVYSDSILETGEDTVYARIATGSDYAFQVNQTTRNVFNVDSLPIGADVARLKTSIACDGLAYIYIDSTNTYELIESDDSLDFTAPRRVLIASSDGTYVSEYNVTVNVHTVDPDAMYWTACDAAPVATPIRAIRWGDRVFLFGYSAEGSVSVSSASVDGDLLWSDAVAAALPAAVDLTSVQLFGNLLYAVADGLLYTSSDGVEWTSVNAGSGFSALLAASDADGRLWAVKDGSLAYSTDGISFTTTESLPAEFPVRGVSSCAYPLATNPSINRIVLVGYTADTTDAMPQVWSVLSTETEWTRYSASTGGEFDCPALAGLAVIRYDGMLYAFGGAGTFQGLEVAAFSAIYVSNDNGLTWKRMADKAVQLPDEIRGSNVPFAAFADNDNRIWIISGGDAPAVWRGRLNRLGF